MRAERISVSVLAFTSVAVIASSAKYLGMTTVRFNSDPDCNEANFKVDNFGDLLYLELLKV